MPSASEQFARVILFQCPQCRGPLASAFSSSNAAFSSGQFSAVCRCGWMGNGLDLSAVVESLQPWEAVADAPPNDDSAHYSTLNAGDWLFRVAKEIAAFSLKA